MLTFLLLRAPADENDPFAVLDPVIFEEERKEIVVHED